MREESITVLHLRRERRRRKKELPLGFCPAAESVEVTLLLLGAVAGAGAACEDTAIRTASSSARLMDSTLTATMNSSVRPIES